MKQDEQEPVHEVGKPWRLRGGMWRAGCSCGYRTSFWSSASEARKAAEIHAEAKRGLR